MQALQSETELTLLESDSNVAIISHSPIDDTNGNRSDQLPRLFTVNNIATSADVRCDVPPADRHSALSAASQRARHDCRQHASMKQ